MEQSWCDSTTKKESLPLWKKCRTAEAYDRLQLLKMPKAERKEYEAHMWNLSYQRSVHQALKREGRTEAMLEVIQKLKALGVGDDIIQSIQ